MSDLVDSLLTLARADEGRFDLHREPVALGPLVRDVVRDRASSSASTRGSTSSMPVLEEAHGGRRRAPPAPALPQPRHERDQVHAARRAAWSCRSAGAWATRSPSPCATPGSASRPPTCPYVFERFWRADRARSRGSERGGFGLGLAICQWIAQAHGGRVTAQSRLGRGLRVHRRCCRRCRADAAASRRASARTARATVRSALASRGPTRPRV